MKKSPSPLSPKILLVTGKLIHMTITQVPVELGCVLTSYLLYLYTGQSEWLYYGIPMISILHSSTNGTRYYYFTPALYAIYMTGACYASFSNTLMCVSLLAASAWLSLGYKSRLSLRIYQISKHFFLSACYTSFVILFLVCLYVAASLIIGTREQSKETLGQACIFSFSVLLPVLFLAIDKYRRNQYSPVPIAIRWIQLTVTETIILAGNLYLWYSILLMAFRSLTPRPYVIYIVIAVILTTEACAKTHEWAAKSWNSLFFQKRNIIYIPLIFLGIAALYVEFSLVGFRPRTLAASILLAALSAVSISRLIKLQRITQNERKLSLYIATGMLVTVFISTIIY